MRYSCLTARLSHLKVRFSRLCEDHETIDEHAHRLELVSRGYIPCTMGRQTVAFSAQLLAFYMKLLVYGPVSRQGWVRALCDFLTVSVPNQTRTAIW